MADWKVNDGYQVPFGGKAYVGGDTFTATDAEIDQIGARPYVTKVVRQQVQPSAANKAVAAPEPHAVTKLPAAPAKPKTAKKK